jgi:hypothetical protein
MRRRLRFRRRDSGSQMPESTKSHIEQAFGWASIADLNEL